MTDVVHQFPEPLDQIGKRIDDAYARTYHGHQQWIDGTLELACALAKAKERFSSNTAFGVWLVENGHNHIGDDDRAALINMALDHVIELTRVVLQETMRVSWRLIWREEIEPRLLRNAAKMEQPAPEPVKVLEFPAQSRITNPNPTRTSVSKRHPFYGLNRAAEVSEIFTSYVKSALGKQLNARGGKDLWQMILDAIDAGF